jgi:phosphoserine phosphatase
LIDQPKGSPCLVVLDMDSTFIQQEVIDLLAVHAGVGAQVVAITERSMRGEIDFRASLAERVALLKGLHVSIFEKVRSEISLSVGAERMVDSLHAAGHKVAIISGGFENVIEPILEGAQVDHWRANILEVENELLTGNTIGPIVDRAEKAEYLRQLAAELSIPLSHTVAIGDGANDLGMMEVAGLSIAFNAKPIVEAAASVTITTGDLYEVIQIMEKYFTDS